MRVLGVCKHLLLVLAALQLPLAAFADEVVLRNSLGARVNGSIQNTNDLFSLAKALDQGADVNQIAAAQTALVPNPDRSAGSEKSTGIQAKYIAEFPQPETKKITIQVFDHKEHVEYDQGVYKKVEVEVPVEEAGVAGNE